MEQDAFRGNDTWKDQSGDASIVFLSAELEEGRVIEEAKNHPGERGQQKRIIARAKPTRLQSSRRLSLVNAIVPCGRGGELGERTRYAIYTHLIRAAAVQDEPRKIPSGISRLSWITEKKIYIDACLIAFLESFFKRILF